MKILFFLLFLSLCLHAEGTKTLHVSAWPGNTEIYLETSKPDISKSPDFITPAKITLPKDQETVLLSFFQPLFKDSTISVKVPSVPDSYLMVILDKESDPGEIYFQEKKLGKRKQRSVGKGMMFGSILPFGIAGFTLLKNYLEYQEAEDIRDKLKSHKIHSQKTESLKQDFEEHGDKSKNYKKATYWFTGAGIALLGIGFYLHF